MPIISNFPTGGSVPDDIVTVAGGGSMEIADTLGDGPYTFEFDADEAGSGASGKSAYEAAVEGGYTGTEEEFNRMIGSGPWVTSEEAEDLPYVKKTGDVMTGALVISDTPISTAADSSTDADTYNVEIDSRRLTFTKNNVTREIKLVNNQFDFSVSEITNIADGQSSDSAATISQLTERVKTLEDALRPLINDAIYNAAKAKQLALDAQTAASGGPFLPLKGGTMSGPIVMDRQRLILSGGEGLDNSVVFGLLGNSGRLEVGNTSGVLTLGKLQTNTPTETLDAANKAYVDSKAVPTIAYSEELTCQAGTGVAGTGMGCTVGFTQIGKLVVIAISGVLSIAASNATMYCGPSTFTVPYSVGTFFQQTYDLCVHNGSMAPSRTETCGVRLGRGTNGNLGLTITISSSRTNGSMQFNGFVCYIAS